MKNNTHMGDKNILFITNFNNEQQETRLEKKMKSKKIIIIITKHGTVIFFLHACIL